MKCDNDDCSNEMDKVNISVYVADSVSSENSSAFWGHYCGYPCALADMGAMFMTFIEGSEPQPAPSDPYAVQANYKLGRDAVLTITNELMSLYDPVMQSKSIIESETTADPDLCGLAAPIIASYLEYSELDIVVYNSPPGNVHVGIQGPLALKVTTPLLHLPLDDINLDLIKEAIVIWYDALLKSQQEPQVSTDDSISALKAMPWNTVIHPDDDPF